ncbi:MAG: FKBP-type peptidyl-prolyl cis-trans isomerase [Gemmatimonadaceae bacterium]|nr:FKBP-type peptidyl-prolyl cis-trans isomerase [Gemmatimonadaceae bacterium]
MPLSTRLQPLLAVAAAAAVVGCAARTPSFPATIPPTNQPHVVIATLSKVDLVAGTGARAEHHRCVYAHYTGWLTDGSKFDSSRDTTPQGQPRSPIAVPLGFRRVIAGWDAGFEGLQVGGKRRLVIPYQFAYGEKGRPPVIPARATLIFDVELLAVADTLPRTPNTTWPACPTYEAVRTAP